MSNPINNHLWQQPRHRDADCKLFALGKPTLGFSGDVHAV